MTNTAPRIHFVDRPDDVGAALSRVDTAVIGIDVERADAHRYHRRAALVQVGQGDNCVLFDAVALDELAALNDFLDDERVAVLHAADNDLVPLARLGVLPDRIADTAVAAALLGLPTGLETLLADFLDVTIEGDKSAFQRADWEQRPLPDDMAAYAAGDVVHLPELWSLLADRLEDQGRTTWYEQELVARIERMESDDRSWRKVKRIGRMSDEQRTIVRVVWEAREELARTHDLAPNHLLRDDAIVRIALDPPTTEAALLRRAQRRHPPIRDHVAALLEAVARGRNAEPESTRPDGQRPMSDVDRAAIDALRKARAEVAEQLGIDAGVLCPARPLASAVMSDPEDAAALCREAELRPWQAELLAEPLWDAYRATIDQARHDATLPATPTTAPSPPETA